VLRAFEGAGVQYVLLKGPSVARWLFPDDFTRTYSDTDLLVRPVDRAAAEELLRRDGFTAVFDEREMPAWWSAHGMAWQHPKSGLVVDLHWTLPGVGVDDESAWSVLSTAPAALDVGGVSAPILSVPARALHVALHAAQHDVSTQAVIRDLDRAVEVVDHETWEAAAELAARLQASGWMAVGLRRRAAGRALAARLGLPEAGAVDAELRAAMAIPEALTLDRIARASSLRERAAIVRYKVAPPATFMRHWSGLARRGRAGLALAYAQRLAWLASRAGPALLAWRRARRRVSGL